MVDGWVTGGREGKYKRECDHESNCWKREKTPILRSSTGTSGIKAIDKREAVNEKQGYQESLAHSVREDPKVVGPSKAYLTSTSGTCVDGDVCEDLDDEPRGMLR
jgi:hypothetical protein